MNLVRQNVFGRNDRPTKARYLAAISEIIGNIQGSRTDAALAELLECSDMTIYNARHGKSGLDPVTLARIGYMFGPAAINPYLKMMSGRGVPLAATGCVDDLAQACSGLTATYIEARHPQSSRGVELCHVENAKLKKQARIVCEIASVVA